MTRCQILIVKEMGYFNPGAPGNQHTDMDKTAKTASNLFANYLFSLYVIFVYMCFFIWLISCLSLKKACVKHYLFKFFSLYVLDVNIETIPQLFYLYPDITPTTYPILNTRISGLCTLGIVRHAQGTLPGF